MAPLTGFDPWFQRLRPASTSPSESRLLLGRSFLSLARSSRLALAVRAAGARASQVPGCSFLTCHALRPRQAEPVLTCNGLARVGFRNRELRPRLLVYPVSGLSCFSRVRVLLAACDLSCVRLQGVVRARSFRRLITLSFPSATLGFGRLVRPFHPFLSS